MRTRSATITVEHVPEGQLGVTGHPLKAGWWFCVQIGADRQRGWCASEQDAWVSAAAQIAGPWGQGLLGL